MSGDDLIRTDKGMGLFMNIRDRAKYTLSRNGAFRTKELVSGYPDTEEAIIMVKRLEEMREIRLVKEETHKPHEVYVKYYR